MVVWLDSPQGQRVIRRTLIGPLTLPALVLLAGYLAYYVPRPQLLFGDGSLYWRATYAWLHGADPWTITDSGIKFAGLPTTLLLNLPLQRFGPLFARWFWGIGGLVAWGFLLWHWGLPFWVTLFPPFWEALVPGQPGPGVVGPDRPGTGALAALTKPYSAPGMLAAGRWRAPPRSHRPQPWRRTPHR